MTSDQPPANLSASVEELATARRAARKLERLRLRGVFTPNQGGPNRKQRRAMRKAT